MGHRGALSPPSDNDQRSTKTGALSITVDQKGTPLLLSRSLSARLLYRSLLSRSELFGLLSAITARRLRLLAQANKGGFADLGTLEFYDAEGESHAFAVASLSRNAQGHVVLELSASTALEPWQVRGSHRTLCNLLDLSHNSQMLLSPDLRIMAYNRVADQRTRLTLGRPLVVGESLLDLLPEAEREATRNFYEGILAGAQHEFINDASGSGNGPFLQINNEPARIGDDIIGIHVEADDVTVRVLAERQRDSREADLRALIDNMSEVVWSLDSELRLRDFNRAFQTIALISVGIEVKPGMMPRDILSEENYAFIRAIGEQVLAGTPMHVEREVRLAGNMLHFEVHANPIVLNEKIVGISFLAKDITQRKAEYLRMQELKEEAVRSLNDLDRVLENSPALILTLGSDGIIQRVSSVCNSILGMPPEALVGKSYLDVLSEPCRQRAMEAFRNSVTKGRVQGEEFDVLRHDGSTVPMMWGATFDAMNRTVHCAGVDITALRMSEDRQQMILENVSDGYMTLTPTLQVSYLNTAGATLLDTPVAQVIGLDLGSVLPTMHRNDLPQLCTTAWTEQRTREIELFLNERSAWIRARVHPSQEGITICFSDITEAKVLHALTRIEQRALTDIADPKLPLNEVVGRFLAGVEEILPGTWCSMLEARADHCLHTLAAPSLPHAFAQHVDGMPIAADSGISGTAAFLRTPVIIDDIFLDTRCVAYQDIARTFGLHACWSYPITGEGDVLLGTFTMYHSVTKSPTRTDALVAERVVQHITRSVEMRRIAESLRQANERFTLAAQATNDILWDRDLVKGTLQWGVAGRRGRDEKAVMDQYTWERSVHPADLEKVLKSMRLAMDDPRGTTWECEYRLILGEGRDAHVLDRGMLLRDEHGVALRMVGAMQDISDRKEKELALCNLNRDLAQRANELLISNAELERFAHVVSHDLQEPLRMISGFMDLLVKRHGEQLDEHAKNYVRFAVDGAQRMKHLLNDLLHYARVGNKQEEFQKTDMAEVMQVASNSLMRTISDTGAELHAEGLPVVLARRTEMIQLVQHLLSNALSYCPDRKPVIRIEAEREEDHWHFKVTDNGKGIEAVDLDRIFIIFQRLEPKKADDSSGVGLSICKKIVEQHGGRIWVGSVPGSGSTFHFTIAA